MKIILLSLLFVFGCEQANLNQKQKVHVQQLSNTGTVINEWDFDKIRLHEGFMIGIVGDARCIISGTLVTTFNNNCNCF